MSRPADLFDLRLALDLIVEAADTYRHATPAPVLEAIALASQSRNDQAALRLALEHLQAVAQGSTEAVPSLLLGRIRIAVEKVRA
jgi:hypothetical protein